MAGIAVEVVEKMVESVDQVIGKVMCVSGTGECGLNRCFSMSNSRSCNIVGAVSRSRGGDNHGERT